MESKYYLVVNMIICSVLVEIIEILNSLDTVYPRTSDTFYILKLLYKRFTIKCDLKLRI